MEIRRAGRSGLELSRLGLGTMTWGRDTDADEAAGQLEAFVAAGGTLLDTSNVFGDGQAETIVGTLVPDIVTRDDIVLASTTVGVSGRARLLTELDASLKRLSTDRVDLWLVHGFDGRVPYEETVSALTLAVRSGRAGYVGVSGHQPYQIALIGAALRAEKIPMTCIESEHSLAQRQLEQDGFAVARSLALGVIGWGPLGRGVLTGKYRHGTPADSRGASPHFGRYVGRYRNATVARIVEAVTTAADGLGTSPLAVACAWARDRPGICATVIGARDTAQLQAALAAEELVLPGEIRAALDDVSDPSSAEPEHVDE